MGLGISAPLYALWEERTHLKIQLSLLADRYPANEAAIREVRQRLEQLDGQIRVQKAADATDDKAVTKRRAYSD